jgi:hypothetical protein
VNFTLLTPLSLISVKDLEHMATCFDPHLGHLQASILHKIIYNFMLNLNRPFATTGSQLKICDFPGETFKGFEVLQFSMSAMTTQLLSSGEFCKLRNDTTPVESASANVYFCTNNSKMPNLEL